MRISPLRVLSISLIILSVHPAPASVADPSTDSIRAAAEKGDSYAQAILAMKYRKGIDVPKDYKQAYRWVKRSSDQNHPLGLNEMALLLEDGLGVAKDPAKANEYFRKSFPGLLKLAEADDVDAQRKLGWMYQNGKGVEENPRDACAWYTRAADQGDFTAKNALMELSGMNIIDPEVTDDDDTESLDHDIASEPENDVGLAMTQEAKTEAWTIIVEAKTAVDEASKALKMAPRGRDTKPYIDAMASDLDMLVATTSEIDDLYTREVYMEARDKAMFVKEKALEICQTVQSAKEKMRARLISKDRNSSSQFNHPANAYRPAVESPGRVQGKESGNENVVDYTPPSLSIKNVEIRDESSDQTIEGGEDFELVVTVANEGGANVEGVTVRVINLPREKWGGHIIDLDRWLSQILPETPKLDLPTPQLGPPVKLIVPALTALDRQGKWISGSDRIESGETKSVVLSGHGPDDLIPGTVQFEIDAVDVHGVGSPKKTIQIQTDRRHWASLELNEVKLISDGNANGRLEANEKGTIRFVITNTGDGVYRYGKTTVASDPLLIFTAGSTKDIRELRPGQTEEMFVSVVVPADLADKQVVFTLTGTGSNVAGGTFTAQSRLTVGADARTEPPVVIQSGRQESSMPVEKISRSDVDVEKNIPSVSAHRTKTLAVIIGNRSYNKKLWNAEYAARDAEWMKEYFVRRMGVDPDNIIAMNNITLSQFQSLFGEQSGDVKSSRLYRRLREHGWDIIVYYSGHGASSADDHSGYLLPVDADPDYLPSTAYRVEALYRNLRQLTDGHVTVILESCFSGRTPKGQIGSKTSGVLTVSPGQNAPQGIDILAAAHSDQVANWYEDQQHGLFTYFLMRALRGDADANADGKVVGAEIKDYVTREVSRLSDRVGVAYQEPEITVAPDWVWTE